MRKGHVHSIKRAKLRQSWNKYNLYNISRLPARPINYGKTFFQQKWKAKSLTRAYHGEQIREKQWERMFTSRLNSVVPMSADTLARRDGSDLAAGRGSGLEMKGGSSRVAKTPYMQMLYAPMERRLDTAIFRALFASSVRQARQLVVHGDVNVNGKKMIYPGYLLNPGDMFQVEPDRVMFATGAPKDRYDRKTSRRLRRELAKKAATTEAQESASEALAEEVEAEQPTSDEVPDRTVVKAADSASQPDSKAKADPKKHLKTLLTQARELLADPRDGLTAKRKQNLRGFQQLIKRAMSRAGAGKFDISQIENLDSQLDVILSKIASSSSGSSSSSVSAAPSSPDLAKSPSSTDSRSPSVSDVSAAERRMLAEALKESQENPVDPTKPYATPWRPRDYMSAFAFIPRYLEVNQNVCSAVYIRHPVARPGAAEVPTPFAHGEHQLAFVWYLRRR